MVGDGDAAAVVCSDRILDYFARPNGLPRLEGRRVSGGAGEVGSNLGPEELEALNGPLRGLADGILAPGMKGLRGRPSM